MAQHVVCSDDLGAKSVSLICISLARVWDVSCLVKWCILQQAAHPEEAFIAQERIETAKITVS
jgi:hypothetical protein